MLCENLCFNLQVLVHDAPPPPPIHILCLFQSKMEPNYSPLIHHSIVALPQTYTEIYIHLYNVSELFLLGGYKCMCPDFNNR